MDASGSQLEPGYLTFRIGPGGGTDIITADPVVQCTARFLRETIGGYGKPYEGHLGIPEHPHQISVDMITFIGANRSVVYLICEHDAERDIYTLRWPD